MVETSITGVLSVDGVEKGRLAVPLNSSQPLLSARLVEAKAAAMELANTLILSAAAGDEPDVYEENAADDDAAAEAADAALRGKGQKERRKRKNETPPSDKIPALQLAAGEM